MRLATDAEGEKGVDGSGSPVRRLRVPRVADIVAQEIRNRIVGGDIEDGSSLPSHQELGVEFGVSGPSIREALRILENEGLISVRRGRSGGAIVHRPSAHRAAFLLGLVLQTDQATVSDLNVAMIEEYAVCVSLCAQLEDRNAVLVPRLRSLLQQSWDAIDGDAVKFERLSREFHKTLISGCGNMTLALVVDSLQSLWWSQEGNWPRRVAENMESLDPKLRQAGLAAHEEIIEVIVAGDALRAADTFRRHMEEVSYMSLLRRSQKVMATDLKWGYSADEGENQ
jgi:GntR family transcriptional repressor for pyruvate dehydrogenase complex